MGKSQMGKSQMANDDLPLSAPHPKKIESPRTHPTVYSTYRHINPHPHDILPPRPRPAQRLHRPHALLHGGDGLPARVALEPDLPRAGDDGGGARDEDEGAFAHGAVVAELFFRGVGGGEVGFGEGGGRGFGGRLGGRFGGHFKGKGWGCDKWGIWRGKR